MDIQNNSGEKYTSGPLYGENPPISVAALKPLPSTMDSRYIFSTKTPSFSYSNIYPPMWLNPPAPFGCGIKSKAVTTSLSGEVSSLKVGSFSFSSPVSPSDIVIQYLRSRSFKKKTTFPHLCCLDQAKICILRFFVCKLLTKKQQCWVHWLFLHR